MIGSRPRRDGPPLEMLGRRVRAVLRFDGDSVRVDEEHRPVPTSSRVVIVGEVTGWDRVGGETYLAVAGYGRVPVEACRRVPGWWRR